MVLGRVSVVGVIALGLLISGCSGVEPKPATTPDAATVDTGDWEAVSFGGTGSGSEKLSVPAEARSIELTVACSGGTFLSISTDASTMENAMDVACGVAVTRLVSLADLPRVVSLSVSAQDATAYAVTGVYSADEAEPDADTVAQCAALSRITSIVFNAEDGYRRGVVAADEWAARIAEASGEAGALSVEGSGLIAQQLAAITSTLARTDLAPGAFQGEAAVAEYWKAMDIVAQACSRNGSSLVTSADFGG
jgi:hypothetical protein